MNVIGTIIVVGAAIILLAIAIGRFIRAGGAWDE